MESAISIFRKLPETKEQISNYHKLIRESVLNGEVEPLVFASQITALENLFKALKQDILIKDVILEEAEKYGIKTFENGSAKFTIKEVGVRFNFDECNDSEFDEINEQIKELTERKKKREKILKALSPDDEVYGSDGVQLMPPTKTSTTQVSVTLK